jgi:hypothetical protein
MRVYSISGPHISLATWASQCNLLLGIYLDNLMDIWLIVASHYLCLAILNEFRAELRKLGYVIGLLLGMAEDLQN